MSDQVCLLLCTNSGTGSDVQYNPANDVIAQNPGYATGILLAILSIVIAYVLYRRALRPKILDFSVEVSSPMLASSSKNVQQELSVLWKGTRINQPKLIEVLVANTGKEAVVKDDYTDPITLQVRDGRVLEANVRYSNPPQAVEPDDLSLDERTGSVLVAPKLLNKGESFVVQIIVDGYSALVAVSARFKNQERPMRRVSLDTPEYSVTIKAGWTAAAICSVLTFTYLPEATGTSVGGIIGFRVLAGFLAGISLGVAVFIGHTLMTFFRRNGRTDADEDDIEALGGPEPTASTGA